METEIQIQEKSLRTIKPRDHEFHQVNYSSKKICQNDRVRDIHLHALRYLDLGDYD